MPSPPGAKGADENKATSDAPGGGGLSQFLGRVLDQLSLSSWLPAAMFVGNASVLVKLRSQAKPDLSSALDDLTGNAFGLLVALAFALVLATIVTQAFEFEAIRLLEGYLDSARGPVHQVAGRRIKRHAAKQETLFSRRKEQEQEAFIAARHAMLALPKPVERTYLDVVEDSVFGRPERPGLDPASRKVALSLDWSRFVPADVLYRLDALDARARAYPQPHRLLPTRLGNVLRASEDLLPLAPGENLEGFGIRHQDSLPETLKTEHRDYRTRLDMYCTLTLAFSVLVPLAGAALGPQLAGWQTALVCASYAVLAAVAYEAAIASARGYGDVLQEIGRHVRRARQEAQDKPLSATARLRAFLHRHLV